jgi:hypothetical protein
MSASEKHYPDGRVELARTDRIEKSPLYNHDLAPVPLARRDWTTYNYAALWISMAHCIPTYMLASGLMTAGMSWLQALVTILLGNTIVLVPILLNSHPGTKYGIPFPVFARAAYGTLGSNVPALMRALVACGWFGIQAWIGGEALHTFFTSLVPGWPALLGAGFGGHTTDGVAVVPALLGDQHRDHLPRHEPAAARRELGRALRARDDGAARGLGAARGGRRRSAARPAREVPDLRRVPARLHPVAHGDDRLLGDAVAQHARLSRASPAASASRCSGRWWRCRRRCSCSRRWAC